MDIGLFGASLLSITLCVCARACACAHIYLQTEVCMYVYSLWVLFKIIQNAHFRVPYWYTLFPGHEGRKAWFRPHRLSCPQRQHNKSVRERLLFSLYLITVYWRWCPGRLPLEEKLTFRNSVLQRLTMTPGKRKIPLRPIAHLRLPILLGNRNLRCNVSIRLIVESINNSWKISIYL